MATKRTFNNRGDRGNPPEERNWADETRELLEEGLRIPVDPLPPDQGSLPVSGNLSVNLQRAASDPTTDQALWRVIRLGTRAIAFDNYDSFLKRVLCEEERQNVSRIRRNADLLHGVDAYQLLRAATEAFLLVHCGVLDPEYLRNLAVDTQKNPELAALLAEDERRFGGGRSDNGLAKDLETYLGGSTKPLPYIERIARGFGELEKDNPFCGTGIARKLLFPCLLELIWSYWHEEGMLVQSINVVSLRFQNKRGPADREPLANFEIHPLRPLTNLLWGYLQDEDRRLTVARRAYEYEHQYGLGLVGKAVPKLRAADHRSKFLEAFHGLLHQVALFYERDANTTIIADGFPLLNALREVHMLLAEGAHNQFRDLPWTARVEMLIQQWLLARPEMREFLGGRAMVPYAEPWMGQVDSLKRLQGWPDTPVTHFHDLAVHGEQILLSIRYGDWSVVNDQDQARNWARDWRPEIQRYIHAYQAVTGVDLAATNQDKQAGLRINATPPSVLLQQRAAQQRGR